VNRIANTFKVLADETRLRILLLLYQEDLCVCEISGILEIPQPRVSQILAKFRDMELVTDKRKEKYIFYSLKEENVTLLNILNWIYKDISCYPQLAADREGIKDKEIYLSRCALSKKQELPRVVQA